MFKKEGRKKDEKLHDMVENSSRLGEMPVFANSLDVKGKFLKFIFLLTCVFFQIILLAGI